MDKASLTEKIVFSFITLLLSVSFFGVIICAAISTIKVIVLVSLIFTSVSYVYSYMLIGDKKKTIFATMIFVGITFIIEVLIYLIKSAII